MSTRLQVVLEEAELEEIRQVARSHRMTVAEWVRQSLRRARANEPKSSVESKLEVLRRATQHKHPTGDIDDMLREIELGHRIEPD